MPKSNITPRQIINCVVLVGTLLLGGHIGSSMKASSIQKQAAHDQQLLLTHGVKSIDLQNVQIADATVITKAAQSAPNP